MIKYWIVLHYVTLFKYTIIKYNCHYCYHNVILFKYIYNQREHRVQRL